LPARIVVCEAMRGEEGSILLAGEHSRLAQPLQRGFKQLPKARAPQPLDCPQETAMSRQQARTRAWRVQPYRFVVAQVNQEQVRLKAGTVSCHGQQDVRVDPAHGSVDDLDVLLGELVS